MKKYPIIIGGGGLVRVIDPKNIATATDIAVPGAIVDVVWNTGHITYAVSHDALGTYLSKILHGEISSPALSFSMTIGATPSDPNYPPTMAVLSYGIVVCLEQMFMKFSYDGTLLELNVVSQQHPKIIDVNNLGYLMVKHDTGFGLFDFSTAVYSTTERFQDIISIRGGMVAVTGLKMHYYSDTLYKMVEANLGRYFSKLANYTNGAVIGFTFDEDAIYTIDPRYGTTQYLFTIDDVANIVSFVGVNTVQLDRDPGWLPGESITITGAHLPQNNGVFTIAILSGPNQYDLVEVVSPDPTAAGIATKKNIPSDITALSTDRYSRYFILDGVTGDVYYGLPSNKILFNSGLAQLASGRHFTGIRGMMDDEVIEKNHVEFSHNVVSASILNSMSVVSGSISMDGYVGTEKNIWGENFVYTDRLIMKVSSGSKIIATYLSNDPILAVSSDRDNVLVMTRNLVSVLDRMTLSRQRAIDISNEATTNVDESIVIKLVDSIANYIRAYATVPATWAPGDTIHIIGSVNPLNNGTYTIANISVDRMDVTLIEPLAASTGPGGNAKKRNSIYSIATFTAPNQITFLHEPGYKVDDKISIVGTTLNAGEMLITSVIDTRNFTVNGAIVNESTITATATLCGELEMVGCFNNTFMVFYERGIFREWSFVSGLVRYGNLDYTVIPNTTRLLLGGKPIVFGVDNNIAVPVKAGDNVLIPMVPAFALVTRGGSVYGFGPSIVPWSGSYSTKVLPDSDGRVYGIINNGLTLDFVEMTEGGLLLNTIPLDGDDYGSLIAGAYDDIVLFKKNDVGSDRGLRLFMKDGALMLPVEEWKYVMNGTLGLAGNPSNYLEFRNMNEWSDVLSWTGDLPQKYDIDSWVGFSYEKNMLSLVVTGVSHAGHSVSWSVYAEIETDSGTTATKSLADAGNNGIYKGDISFSILPKYCIVTFTIIDNYSSSSIRRRHIVSFGKR